MNRGQLILAIDPRRFGANLDVERLLQRFGAGAGAASRAARQRNMEDVAISADLFFTLRRASTPPTPIDGDLRAAAHDLGAEI
mmetsp:Transcript_8504/g.29998  ORF Transcript_8504/g.29998 Transcript_8504/m.29998 type:complete len:83 (-) Transcript_8504:41-289(-)